MKAEELRIGNIFMWSGFASMGQGEDIVSLRNIGYHNLMEPIPLSEEWLLRFGFEQNDNTVWSDSFYFIPVGGSMLHINPKNGVVWITRNENIFNNPALVEYVHQLQNLYFALIGKEITIAHQETNQVQPPQEPESSQS